MTGKFPLGRVVATPGVLDELEEACVNGATLLARHHNGDWGDLEDCDKQANERDLIDGERLLSCYLLPTGAKVYINTEWNRSYTTIMLAQEY